MRQEKQLLLDEIKEKIDRANALVLTKYASLTPDLSADFRSQLAEVGGSYAVVKKRVFLKAAEEAGIEIEPSLLEGHIGVLFAEEDPISPTKKLFEFAGANQDLLEILAGQFEGKLCDKADVKAISELPTQDEMRAQFLGLLEAPMSETLSVFDSLLTSVIYCLENKSAEAAE